MGKRYKSKRTTFNSCAIIAFASVWKTKFTILDRKLEPHDDLSVDVCFSSQIFFQSGLCLNIKEKNTRMSTEKWFDILCTI